jgi:hypothetical protein
MPTNIKDFYGTKLTALDGDIGHVTDFYFDDQAWVIRYVVADTGSWLSGRRVLLSPFAFGSIDEGGTSLPVNLTRQQIENSPAIETKLPVSRQYEIQYYRYFGWPTYWEGSWSWGIGSHPVLLPLAQPDAAAPRFQHDQDDNHLRSSREVDGYSVDSLDGIIGHVCGFTSDPRTWAIREVMVETGPWYAGKEILIAPDQIDEISFADHKLRVNLTKADAQITAKDKIVQSGSGEFQAVDFHD